MRSHAQLHVLNQEISRANNFAAEEPPPASFTWLRNVVRSVTGETLCDTTNVCHQPPPLPTHTITKSHHFKPSILVFFVASPQKNIDGKNHLFILPYISSIYKDCMYTCIRRIKRFHVKVLDVSIFSLSSFRCNYLSDVFVFLLPSSE